MKNTQMVLGIIVLALIGLVVTPVENNTQTVDVAPQTTQVTHKVVNNDIATNEIGGPGEWQDDDVMTAAEKKQLAIEGEIEEIGLLDENGVEIK
ncbi:hypothetical protein pwc_7 [Weissella phage PWc]|nr:hypothetical protein pwc_7 [Weissella phage PWc]